MAFDDDAPVNLLYFGCMKVIHITPWYPTPSHPLSGIWIQRHIEALEPYAEQEVIHVPAFTGPWRLREWQMGRWIKKKLKGQQADIFNFHIAYPALVYGHHLPKSVQQKLVITEHWSSYRFHFHSSKKLSRIKRIFRREWPLIAVSQQLANDIETFAECSVSSKYVIPNVVDAGTFTGSEAPRSKTVIMGSYWKPPKDPIRAIQVLDSWLLDRADWKVEVFGLGPMEDSILRSMSTAEHSSQFKWLGKLTPEEIATRMRQAAGFVHVSEYETFSVVCAEALSCGTPVLFSPKGALPEVVGEDGKELPDNRDWIEILDDFAEKAWDHGAIAERAHQRFSKEAVGKRYFAVLEELCRSRDNIS